jgi:hypothetical protein
VFCWCVWAGWAHCCAFVAPGSEKWNLEQEMGKDHIAEMTNINLRCVGALSQLAHLPGGARKVVASVAFAPRPPLLPMSLLWLPQSAHAVSVHQCVGQVWRRHRSCSVSRVQAHSAVEGQVIPAPLHPVAFFTQGIPPCVLQWPALGCCLCRLSHSNPFFWNQPIGQRQDPIDCHAFPISAQRCRVYQHP